jgi:hypothetical protein
MTTQQTNQVFRILDNVVKWDFEYAMRKGIDCELLSWEVEEDRYSVAVRTCTGWINEYGVAITSIRQTFIGKKGGLSAFANKLEGNGLRRFKGASDVKRFCNQSQHTNEECARTLYSCKTIVHD